MSTATSRPFVWAIHSYDHVEDVVQGRIPIEGYSPLPIRLPIPEMFRRFVFAREWDVSEMSFVQYGTLRAGGDDRIVGIPVFPSRVFRQSAVYVRSDRIHTPEDLRGGRIGVVGWSNSAAVWGKGLLADMHGIELSDVTWFQGGLERPGRPEFVPHRHLADDIEVVPVTDRGIEPILWDGDLDAIIVPAPPHSVETSAAAGGLIRRLYEDVPAAERAYRDKTGCLPIMHVVAMRREMVDADPLFPALLFRALERARDEYLDQLTDPAAPLVPLPWMETHLAHVRRDLGEVWPYGVEANRRTLETYLRYLRSQGLIDDAFEMDSLFPEWSAAMAAADTIEVVS